MAVPGLMPAFTAGTLPAKGGDAGVIEVTKPLGLAIKPCAGSDVTDNVIGGML